MIELKKTIVDDKRQLIGFITEGTEKDFGGIDTTTKIQRTMSIQTMLQNGFANKQLTVMNGQIYMRGDFKINQLDMVVRKLDGSFINVSNEINITKQFLMNNKRVGYEVTFADGSHLNIRYNNVIALTTWFKPGNFVVRQLKSGKKFISGKDIRLDDLPTVELGKKSEAKRANPADGKSNEPVSGVLENGFDIIDVYEILSEMDGYIVNPPNTKYERTSGTQVQLNNFMAYGVGDIASSKLEFTATKLNVNAKFKRVGAVKVEVNGVPMPVTTFVYSTKNIFFDGKNHMKQFGIAIKAEHEQQFVNALGKSLALTKMTDEKSIKAFGQLINNSNIVVYTVNTENIDLMSENKVEKYRAKANAKNLAKLCKESCTYTLAGRYLDAEIREIKKKYGTELNGEGNISSLMAMYKDDVLEEIKKSGIDIFSGAYKAPKEDTTTTGSDKDAKTVEIEVEYELATHKCDSKMTGASIIKALDAGEAGKINEDSFAFLKQVKEKLDATKSPAERLKLATKTNAEVKSRLNKVKKNFWLINTALYIEGKGQKLFVSRQSEWEPVLKTRVKTALVWSNKTEPNLIVKIKGATI